MMEQMQANFHNTLQAALSQRQAPQQQFQDDPEPTDEELDAAALEGKGVGAAVKRAVKAATNRLARQNQQEVAQVRDVGRRPRAAKSHARETGLGTLTSTGRRSTPRSAPSRWNCVPCPTTCSACTTW